MNSPITLNMVKERLEEQNIKYSVLSLSNDCCLLVMERGGRILGPFWGEDGESIFWVNEVFREKEAFQEFLEKENSWNIGGDRIWIAPEFPFFTKKRTCFFDTYIVQPGIDPGNYSLTEDAGGNIKVSSRLEGEMYESEYASKEVYLEKTIHVKENPLKYTKNYEKLMKRAAYAGFEHEVFLKDESEEKPLEMEMWNLTQIHQGGTLLVPYTGEADYVSHYNPLAEGVVKDQGHFMEVTVDTKTDYKIGFPAAAATGRAGYLNRLSDHRWYLLIKSYENDPSADYVSEPWNQPGKRGSSLYLYMDGGAQGGFAEFENVGKPFGGKTGRSCTMDTTSFWLYLGSREDLLQIAKVLLGI